MLLQRYIATFALTEIPTLRELVARTNALFAHAGDTISDVAMHCEVLGITVDQLDSPVTDEHIARLLVATYRTAIRDTSWYMALAHAMASSGKPVLTDSFEELVSALQKYGLKKGTDFKSFRVSTYSHVKTFNGVNVYHVATMPTGEQ